MTELLFQQKFRISNYSDSYSCTFTDRFEIIGCGEVEIELLSEENSSPEFTNKIYLAKSKLPFAIVLMRSGIGGNMAPYHRLDCLPVNGSPLRSIFFL